MQVLACTDSAGCVHGCCVTLMTLSWCDSYFLLVSSIKAYASLFQVLFRYSLAIFKSCEDELLKLKDSGAIYKYFRRIPSRHVNPHRISHIAFQQMNPFPKKNITTKRNQHRPKLEV